MFIMNVLIILRSYPCKILLYPVIVLGRKTISTKFVVLYLRLNTLEFGR